MLWRNRSKVMVSDSLRVGRAGGRQLLKIFREDSSTEVTFESAVEWWEGDSRVDNWGRDSKCQSPEVVGWTGVIQEGRDVMGEGGLTAEVLLAAVYPVSVGVGKVFSKAFQTMCSLISLTTLTSCMFKLHFKAYLCSDLQ